MQRKTKGNMSNKKGLSQECAKADYDSKEYGDEEG
jgi:hypothetical protein